MRACLLLALLATACGRVGYQPRVGSPADGAVAPADTRQDGPGGGTADAREPTDAAAPADGAAPQTDVPSPPDTPVPDGSAPAQDTRGPDAPTEDARPQAPDAPPPTPDTAPPTPDTAPPDLPPPPAHDYCATVPRLNAAPIIDGVLEPGLELAPLPANGWRGDHNEPAPTEERTSFAFAYQPNGIYAYVEVTDPFIVSDRVMDYYCGDAVELFLDGDGAFTSPPFYDEPGTRQFVISAPASATAERRSNVYAFNGAAVNYGPWASQNFLARRTATGYVIEALIDGADVAVAPFSLQSGVRIGLDLMIDTQLSGQPVDPACPRSGVFALRRGGNGCGVAYCDVGAFCTPTLE